MREDADVSIDDCSGLHVGEQVSIAAYEGVIRFLGETKFSSGNWVGIELLESVGRNDGTVFGVQYFSCSQNHGIFVRPRVLKNGAKKLESSSQLPPESEAGIVDLEAPAKNTGVRFSAEADNDTELVRRESEFFSKRASRVSRRCAVSAETLDTSDVSSWTPPCHEKSSEERAELDVIIKTSADSKLQMMFGAASEAAINQVIDAMFMKSIGPGEAVDDGNFYIVKAGLLDVLEKDDDGSTRCAFQAGAGFVLGGESLLQAASRDVLCKASSTCDLWCLDQKDFQMLVVASFERRFKQYCEFLKNCDIFAELDEDEIAALADVLEEEAFENDEAILEQGERDDKMYILLAGEAVACIKGEEGEVEVMRYKQGDYFGEIALLLQKPREASVYAIGSATCLYICRDSFRRLLGPLGDVLQRNIEQYKKYSEFLGGTFSIRSDTVPLNDEVSKGLDVFDGGLSLQRRRTRHMTKKRDRTMIASLQSLQKEDDEIGEQEAQVEEKDEREQVEEVKEDMEEEGEEEKEPTTLAEKIALDYKKSQLVKPDSRFAVHDSIIQMFGGLRLGEKFQVDKSIECRTDLVPEHEGLEDIYSWCEPSSLEGSTRVAVLCQKGQKSPSDPTPNQDNYFVLHTRGVGIYGVCDGHGPFGHLVSFRVVQTLPHFLTTSEHFGKDWELAFREAFLAAQSELLSFCTANHINVEASGSSGSIVVREAHCLHFAHIGDSSVILASWNRRSQGLVLATKDHKPQVEAERARLEAAGSEVRQIDEDSYRIFIKGTNFPGLTMARTFGDTACGGVIQEPTYVCKTFLPSEEYYVLLASDGIWEFIDFEKGVDLSAKKLRLKGPRETVRFLTEASRKRWACACGDYCDDITGILVQWNGREDTSQINNHFLHVARPADQSE